MLIAITQVDIGMKTIIAAEEITGMPLFNGSPQFRKSVFSALDRQFLVIVMI
jgi:hypothetical protein